MIFNLRQFLERFSLNLGQWLNRTNSPSTKQKNTAGDNIGRDKNIYINDTAQRIYDLQLKIYNVCKNFSIAFYSAGGPNRETLKKFNQGVIDAGISLNETDYRWIEEIKTKSIEYIHKCETLLNKYPGTVDRLKLSTELEALERWFSEQLNKEKINTIFRKYLNKNYIE